MMSLFSTLPYTSPYVPKPRAEPTSFVQLVAIRQNEVQSADRRRKGFSWIV